MALQLINEITLQDEADAIREQEGSSAPIQVEDYAARIRALDKFERLVLNKDLSTYTNETFSGFISDYAFAGLNTLLEVNIPLATKILSYAFQNCSSLTEVSFPVCTIVQYRGFYGCSALITASFPVMDNVSGGAFQNCSSLVTATMPKLKTINGDAFLGCSSLQTLDVGEDANGGSIGTNAFKDSAIQALVLRNSTMTTLANTNAFTNTPIEAGTGYIYVPEALLDTYKAASNWSTFSAQFRKLEDYTADGTTSGAFVRP